MADGFIDPMWMRQRGCCVCEDAKNFSRDLAYTQGAWKLVECANCRFTYAKRILHVPYTYTPVHGAPRRRAGWVPRWVGKVAGGLSAFHLAGPHELLNRLGPASGNVVDISVSDRLVSRLSERFFLYGFETFSALTEVGREAAAQLGMVVLRERAAEGLRRFSDRSLAGAVVHEHLERDVDARQVIELLSRKLRLDGVAVLRLPNHGSLSRHILGRRWYRRRFPEHLNYFRKRDISVLARSFDLEAVFPFMVSSLVDGNFTAILRPVAPLEIF